MGDKPVESAKWRKNIQLIGHRFDIVNCLPRTLFRIVLNKLQQGFSLIGNLAKMSINNSQQQLAKLRLISLLEVENSIAEEYRATCSHEQYLVINQLEIIRFLTIPDFFPNKFTCNFNRFFGLGQCLLYEMFTVVVFQYLFTSINQIKRKTLQNLKQLIYDQNFMSGNAYTKGMMAEGFKLMDQKSVNLSYLDLIVQPLLEKGLMKAFVECWKALVDRICLEYSIDELKEHDEVEVMELLSAYFQIQFGISVQKDRKIEELIACTCDTHISIVFNNDDYQQESLPCKCFVLLDNVSDPPPQSKTLRFLKSLEKAKPFEAIIQESQSMITSIHQQSRISEIDVNFIQDQHDQLKRILPLKHLESTTSKKNNPGSEKQLNLSQILQKAKQTIQMGESLVCSVERFCQDLGD